MEADQRCPCGSGHEYSTCCGPLHEGREIAATAEALMRSRYSAFALHNADYLFDTWDPRTRPETVELGDGLTWLSLQVIEASTDQVEFVARFRGPSGRGFVRERSQFVRSGERWFYLAAVED